MNPPEECPESYDTFQDACYRFGSHTSYDDALSMCERDGSRLVDVDPANTNYVKTQVKAYGGGNDFWIGTYYQRNKLVKRKGTTGCPIMRGQQSPGGLFATVPCNPSYRFVCQKYGGRKFGINRRPGLNGETSDMGFDLLPGEQEIPLTPATTAAPSSTPPPEAGVNPAIPAVISVVALLVVAILLRFYCKRREARSLRKQKEMLRLDQEKKSASRLQSTMTAASVNPSINKAFNLPTGGSRAPSSMSRSVVSSAKESRFPESRGPSVNRGRDESTWGHQSRTGRKPRRDTDSEYRHYSKRSMSVERSLHGIQKRTPSPPYGHRRRSHGGGRSRSVSRRRSTSGYSGSSRSSSLDSRASDSMISTITATTFRRSGRDTPHDYDRGYSRSTTPSRHRSDRYSSHDDHKRSRTLYDRYAAAQPPISAHEMLTRTRNGGDNLGSYRGFDPRYDLERQRMAMSNEQHYFPQMTNVLAWSDEDLSRREDGTGRFQNQPQKLAQSRFPRQAPIRVNRHIHDYEEGGRNTSTESDHVYESLDKMRRRSSDRDMSRDSISRSSGRSRASMRGRRLPAIPTS